jgi:hypothetical protein
VGARSGGAIPNRALLLGFELGAARHAGMPAPPAHKRWHIAKLMTLFHPATGRVRVKGVLSCTNAVLHPWLEENLVEAILARTCRRGSSLLARGRTGPSGRAGRKDLLRRG